MNKLIKHALKIPFKTINYKLKMNKVIKLGLKIPITTIDGT